MPLTNVEPEKPVEPGFQLPDVVGDVNTTVPPCPEPSITMDPNLLNHVDTSSAYDFKMEDMAWAYSVGDKMWYLFLVGYQWQSDYLSNTTWRILVYNVTVAGATNTLTWRTWKTPGTTERSYRYNSAFSSIAVADINEDGLTEIVCGGNITYSGYTRAYYRVFRANLALTNVSSEFDQQYLMWNTAVKSLELKDVNADGHTELVSNTLVSPGSLPSRSVVYVYPNIYLGNTIFAYYDATLSNGWYAAVWNDMKIEKVNSDKLPEIVLSGYTMKQNASPKVATVFALNYDTGTATAEDFQGFTVGNSITGNTGGMTWDLTQFRVGSATATCQLKDMGYGTSQAAYIYDPGVSSYISVDGAFGTPSPVIPDAMHQYYVTMDVNQVSGDGVYINLYDSPRAGDPANDYHFFVFLQTSTHKILIFNNASAYDDTGLTFSNDVPFKLGFWITGTQKGRVNKDGGAFSPESTLKGTYTGPVTGLYMYTPNSYANTFYADNIKYSWAPAGSKGFMVAGLDFLEDELRPTKQFDFSKTQSGMDPNGTDGWISTNAAKTETVVKKNYGDHYDVLKITDISTSGAAQISNTIAATNMVNFKFDVAFPAKTHYFYLNFRAGGVTKMYFYIYQGSLYAYNYGVGYTKVTSLDAATWYTITVEYDGVTTANGRFRVFVNDHAMTGYMSAYSTISNLVDWFRFYTQAPLSDKLYTYFIDNIYVLQPSDFDSSEFTALDLKDVNQDGGIDIVTSVNRHSFTSGNYSTQLVLTKRLVAPYKEEFESYAPGANIDRLGFWRSVNGIGCTSTMYNDGSSGNWLNLYDPSITTQAQAWWDLPGTVPAQGSVKFTARSDNVARGTYFWVVDGISDTTSIPNVSPAGACQMRLYNNVWWVYDGVSGWVNLRAATSNTNFNIEICFKVGVGFHVLIGGIKYVRSGNASDYSYRFLGTPIKFDHFEVQTFNVDLAGSFNTRVDNIEPSWSFEYLGHNKVPSWNLEGNVNLEKEAGITDQALILKRNKGAAQADISTRARAMAFGFNEISMGSVSFWAKSEADVAANFQLVDLYAYPSASPAFLRLCVDSGNNIRRNTSDTSSIDTGYDWVTGLWHYIKVDFSINSIAMGAFINVSYDGNLILNNINAESSWNSVNNITFSLSENYAGKLYIDDLKIDFSSSKSYVDFDLRERTMMMQADNLLSTWTLDISADNEDADPYSEVHVAAAYVQAGKMIGVYVNFVFKSGVLSMESSVIPTIMATSAYNSRIVISPAGPAGARYMFIGGNYYYAAGLKYYAYITLYSLSPEKSDRSSLVLDTGGASPI
nr:hypothetical protein [Candidatus Sigynarchaeota archaeon]